MTAERWQQIKSICGEILELPPEQRGPAIDSACGPDTELREAVEKLVRDYESGEAGALDPPIRILPALETGGLEAGELVVEKYRVLHHLGSGGMGEVYEAADQDTNRRVALKTIRPSRRKDPAMEKRLIREASLSQKIEHPHVCRVQEIVEHHRESGESVLVLVMDLIPGRTLSSHLRQGRTFSNEETLAIGQQLASGLEAAHAAGVIHRDLKPSNVMLEESSRGPRAALLDLGLASPSAEGVDWSSSLTDIGTLIGTPDYMAPEQLRGQKATPRSDTYSLAVILFEMLTGQRPSFGSHGIDEVLRRCTQAPPQAQSIRPEVSPAWNKALLRALAPIPERRFASPGALIEAAGKAPKNRALWIGIASTLVIILLAAVYWQTRQARLGGKLGIATAGERSSELRFLFEKSLGQSRWIRPVLLDAKNWKTAQSESAAKNLEYVALASFTNTGELSIKMERRGTMRPAWESTEKGPLPEAIDKLALLARGWSGDQEIQQTRYQRSLKEIATGSQEALQFYLAGNALGSQMKRREAVEELKKAIAFDPNFALAHYRLGDLLVGLWDYPQAIKHYELALQAVQQGRVSYCEGLKIGALFRLDMGDQDAAEGLLKEQIRSCAPDAQPHFFVSSVYRNRGDFQRAKAELDEAERLEPNKMYIQDAQARVAYLAGDLEAVKSVIVWYENNRDPVRADTWRGIWHQARGEFAQAEVALKNACEAKPQLSQSTYACNLLAQIQGDQGKFAQAYTTLIDAAAVDDSERREGQAAGKRLGAAWCALQLGRTQEASNLAYKAVESIFEPKQVSHAAIIFRYLKQKPMLESLLVRLKPLSTYPKFRAAELRVKAELACMENHTAECLENYLAATKMQPVTWERTSLARAYLAVQDNARAQQLFETERTRPLAHWPEKEGGLPGYLEAVRHEQ